MNKLLNQILEYGSLNCVHCGSFFVGKSMLCSYCEKVLFLQCSVTKLWENEEEGVPFYSLFSWEQDKSVILNRLIMNLKGDKQARANQYFGKIISTRLKEMISANDKVLVCPCPSWSQNKDHAYYLATEISAGFMTDLKFPLLNGIKKQESKNLSKSERMKNIEQRFIINERFFEKFTQPHQTTLLFVDDVITTRATLLAAREKLKDFKQIMGVSLAFRR